MSIRKVGWFILFCLIVVSLSGCLGQSTEEKMYNAMEEAVKEEKVFEEQQQPLEDLEKKERELYEKIISLGSKDKDQIMKLADEALSLVSERKKYIKNEKISIQSSKEKFETIEPLISELKDEELKTKANELNEMMKKRYELHNSLYEQYLLGIQYDQELYEQLKAKDVSFEKLEEQVSKINETYSSVLKTNDEFNKQTKKYNEAKKDFYKKANMNISE